MDFRGILYDAAVEMGAEVRVGCGVASIDPMERTVTLASGEVVTADVIVGADGIHGVSRRALLGREPTSSQEGFSFYT